MGIVLLDSPRVFFLSHLGWEKRLYKEECHDSLSKAMEMQSSQKTVNSSISEFLNSEFLFNLDAHFCYLKSISGTHGLTLGQL